MANLFNQNSADEFIPESVENSIGTFPNPFNESTIQPPTELELGEVLAAASSTSSTSFIPEDFIEVDESFGYEMHQAVYSLEGNSNLEITRADFVTGQKAQVTFKDTGNTIELSGNGDITLYNSDGVDITDSQAGSLDMHRFNELLHTVDPDLTDTLSADEVVKLHQDAYDLEGYPGVEISKADIFEGKNAQITFEDSGNTIEIDVNGELTVLHKDGTDITNSKEGSSELARFQDLINQQNENGPESSDTTLKW